MSKKWKQKSRNRNNVDRRGGGGMTAEQGSGKREEGVKMEENK